jgi:hypothetical protein
MKEQEKEEKLFNQLGVYATVVCFLVAFAILIIEVSRI